MTTAAAQFQEFVEAAPVAKRSFEERMDGWISALGSFGTSRDKRQYVDFSADFMSDVEVQQLWRGNAVAKRVIEVIPKETMRTGFKLKCGDKEISEKAIAKWEDLKALAKYVEVMCWKRAYGGGAIFPIINDSVGDLSKPLNKKKISGIRGLQTFEARELKPWKWYSNPLDDNFGHPETYRLQPIAQGGFITSMFGTEIHESRLIIFRGRQVSRSQVSINQGWGDTVLMPPRETLRDYGISWAATAVLLHEFAQASMKIKGLADALAGDNDDIIKARISAVMLARSTINAVLMDAEEEFERKQTPVSGLADLLSAFATKLASDCDMPVTLLMGQSPAGLNATGESDIRFFYDRVSADREFDAKPQVEQLFRLIFLSLDGPTGGKEPETWSVEFNPLWQQTEQEIATTRKTVAETDQINITNGLYTAAQAAKSHYGGDTYSIEVNIDVEEIEAAELNAEDMANLAEGEIGPDGKPIAQAPPVIGPDGKPVPGTKPIDAAASAGAAGTGANVQSTAMNGAQVTSLISVIEKAAKGEISRESAKAILMACFPVTPEEAEAMLGPEDFEPVKEEPPIGFGGPPGAGPPGQTGEIPKAVAKPAKNPFAKKAKVAA